METTAQHPEGTGKIIGAGDYAVGLAWAKRYTDRFSLGGHFRYARETLDNHAISNMLFDIGTLYYTGYRHVRIGITILNIGGNMKYLYDSFRSPTMFKVGVADELIDSEPHKLTLAADMMHPTDNIERINLGIEYWFMNGFALRAGYKFRYDQEGLTLGIGFKHALGPFNGKIDYAYGSFGRALGVVHRISMGFSL